MDEKIHKELIVEHQLILTKLGADLFHQKITFPQFYEKIDEEKRRFEDAIKREEAK